MKFFILLLYISTVSLFLNAQNSNFQNGIKKDEIIPVAQKKSISILGISSDKELENKFKEVANVPDKYREIDLAGKLLSPPESSTKSLDETIQFSENTLVKWLNDEKIGQQILSSCFNRQDDGSFSFDKCIELGILDSGDTGKILEMAEKRRSLLSEIDGLKQVNQIYMLVFHFYDFRTMEQDYARNGVEQNFRILNGFIVSYNSYLLKFDFNNAIASKFFSDYWCEKGNTNIEQKSKAFEDAEFPFFLVWSDKNEIAAVQNNKLADNSSESQKSDDELLTNLVTLSVNRAIQNLEEEGSFSADNMILSTEPISAKLGKKENVKFDQSYTVYENRIDDDGNMNPKRMGVVKAMKIVDNTNKQIKTSDASAFYQISGRKIDNAGMYLKRKKDIGINLYAGKGISGLKNTNVRLEYYISKIFNDSYEPGKMAKKFTAVKMYVEGGFNEESYLFNENIEDFKFTRGSIGINKDFYPSRFFHWGPFLGYGMEYAKSIVTREIVSSNFVETGLRLGINILPSVQMVGAFNKYFLIKSILLDENRDVKDDDFDYSGLFSNRNSAVLSLGIRILL